MDVTRGELVEAELDRLIERCHGCRVTDDGERPAEEAWAASERLHSARRERENRAAWYGYLMASADSIERTAAEIAAGKRAQAERLMQRTDERMTA